MQFTHHQAKFLAHELTRRWSSDSMGKLAAAVAMDENRCVASVIGHFDTAIKALRTNPRSDRFLHLCVAVREIESWYLADEEAIHKVIPDVVYAAPPDTGSQTKGTLKALVKKTLGKNASFNEIDFAKHIAPAFNPKRAKTRSKSFACFWKDSRRAGMMRPKPLSI